MLTKKGVYYSYVPSWRMCHPTLKADALGDILERNYREVFGSRGADLCYEAGPGGAARLGDDRE